MDNTQTNAGMGNWVFTVYNPDGRQPRAARGILRMDGKTYVVSEPIDPQDPNGQLRGRDILVVPAQNVAFVENVE